MKLSDEVSERRNEEGGRRNEESEQRLLGRSHIG